jgi:hypothetical protein
MVEVDFFLTGLETLQILGVPFFLGNFVIKGYSFFMSLQSEKKL